MTNSEENQPLELIKVVEDKGAKTFIYRDPDEKKSLVDKLLRRK